MYNFNHTPRRDFARLLFAPAAAPFLPPTAALISRCYLSMNDNAASTPPLDQSVADSDVEGLIFAPCALEHRVLRKVEERFQQ